jgi:hypothetical protein
MTTNKYEPMTHAEMVDLLTVIANFDHRQPNADTVRVWLLVAHEAQWRADEAARAVVRHFAHSTEYLKPGHITALIHEARRADRQPLLALPGPAKAQDETREQAMAAAEVVYQRLATTKEERWKLRRLFSMPFSLTRARARNSPEDERRRGEAAAELERLRQKRDVS